jgi:hypothetical protein
MAITKKDLERLKKDGAKHRLAEVIGSCLWQVRVCSEDARKNDLADFEENVGKAKQHLEDALAVYQELKAL